MIAWHFPNRENYWNNQSWVKGAKLRNRYGDLWKDAWDVAGYVVNNMDRLEAESAKFRDALYNSTLPRIVTDAAGANMSILRTNTGLLLEDNRFYGFEGCSDNRGCCPMNCTHVYNYEQSLAFLYPRLESSMRLTDFTHQVRKRDGKMVFRTLLPLGKRDFRFHAAADGQMGCILKLWREYRMSGDWEFVKSVYPGLKKAMEYAWLEWDKDQDGVMEGIQHNTYDIEFHGPNTMMGRCIWALCLHEEDSQEDGDTRSRQVQEGYTTKAARSIDMLGTASSTSSHTMKRRRPDTSLRRGACRTNCWAVVLQVARLGYVLRRIRSRRRWSRSSSIIGART